MFKLLYQGVVAAILSQDTATALSLLQDSHSVLLDPLEGPIFHAEMLYYAIKKANINIIQYLLNLHINSDVSFFNYCGRTPIGLTLEEGLNEIVPEVIAKTDKNLALHMAVKLQDNKLTSLLLKHCVFKSRILRFLNLE